MTNFLLTFMRLQEWFEVHFLRWRPAHVELEDETDEGLKDIGLQSAQGIEITRRINRMLP